MLQGDLISPLYFIIALAFVFKKSDPGGSTNILGLLIDALFYADDAALLTSTAEETAERIDAICKALRELADMEIHLGKTKVMHAQETIDTCGEANRRGSAKTADGEMRGMMCRLHDCSRAERVPTPTLRPVQEDGQVRV